MGRGRACDLRLVSTRGSFGTAARARAARRPDGHPRNLRPTPAGGVRSVSGAVVSVDAMVVHRTERRRQGIRAPVEAPEGRPGGDGHHGPPARGTSPVRRATRPGPAPIRSPGQAPGAEQPRIPIGSVRRSRVDTPGDTLAPPRGTEDDGRRDRARLESIQAAAGQKLPVDAAPRRRRRRARRREVSDGIC